MDIQTRPDPVARARELAAEIAAAADEIEHTRCIPEALLGRLHDSRLFCCPARPVATRQSLRAGINELARYDASIAFVANSSALIAAYLEPAVSYAIFTDPRSSRCSAVAVA